MASSARQGPRWSRASSFPWRGTRGELGNCDRKRRDVTAKHDHRLVGRWWPIAYYGDDVSIGANSVITGDNKMGPGSIIEPGALAVESCGPNRIINGPKAKVACREKD